MQQHPTRQEVRNTLDIYIRAWVGQDPDLIVSVFTDTATYHERVLEAPILGSDGIRAYWQSKVVEQQANLKVELLSLYLDGSTAIAEWEAEFDDTTKGVRKRMQEIAVLSFQGGLIDHLREYWASQTVADIPDTRDGV